MAVETPVDLGGAMSVCKPLKFVVFLCLVAFLACGTVVPAVTIAGAPARKPAEPPAPAEVSHPNNDARSAIRSGAEMERSGRWIDAIEHYKSALKQWPDNKQLQYGLRRSKIHFGIERRYTDASFETDLLRKSSGEALTLLSDVMAEVQTYYVEPVSSTSYIAHGTESLYFALANDKFLQTNLANADPSQIDRLRTLLRERYWNKPVADRSDAQQTVSEVSRLADSVVGLSPTAVVMEYVFGGCNALDDYSSFLTPNRMDDLYGNIEGEFVGLGIEIQSETGRGLLLVNVLPDSPAREAGLFQGDHIVGINGVDCRDLTTDEGARLLRGPVGSRVRLSVQEPADGGVRDRTIVRRPVKVKSIPVAEMVDREHGIGYIEMTGFQKTSVSELDDALRKLRRQGMRALIWDLRGNPGGLLTAAAEVLDRFIDQGVLVTTKGRTADQNWTYTAHRSGTSALPLVLLVDGDSASASEIVAGAIHDHRRGAIVGRKTFGKWSVQSLFEETGLRLTTAKFYSPSGQSYNHIGLEPDVAVTAAAKHSTYFRGPVAGTLDSDPDLQKGVELLKSRISQR